MDTSSQNLQELGGVVGFGGSGAVSNGEHSADAGRSSSLGDSFDWKFNPDFLEISSKILANGDPVTH